MAWVALAEESTQRCFGLRISSNQCGVALRARTRGQDRSGTTGGEKLSGRATYRRRFRAEIPAVAGADSGQAGSGKAPGGTAELLRGLAELVAQRCGVAAAALRALRGGASRVGWRRR